MEEKRLEELALQGRPAGSPVHPLGVLGVLAVKIKSFNRQDAKYAKRRQLDLTLSILFSSTLLNRLF
jgi:hypothetical protein